MWVCVVNTFFSVKCIHQRHSTPAILQRTAWWAGSAHTTVAPVTLPRVTLKFCPQETLTHPDSPIGDSSPLSTSEHGGITRLFSSMWGQGSLLSGLMVSRSVDGPHFAEPVRC